MRFKNGFLDSQSEFKNSLRFIQILLDKTRLPGSK
jgi:hypothetical protein